VTKREEQLLIGIHPVASALDNTPQQVSRLIIATEARNSRVLELEQQAQKLGIAVERSDRSVLDRRSSGERHQDVLAQFNAENIWAERDLERLVSAIGGQPFILVLDGVQDPHNLGACLRSAEAGGVQLVIVPKDRSASLSPVARRAAAGAAEVLDIVVVTDLRGPLGLVMGGEGQGVRRLTSDLCDYHVRIPMYGTVSSLNVSVATAICIYEINRQRHSK